LLEPAAPRGLRLPIDFFFRSLAQDQRERAVGIVLSGTGSDGTLGLRAIKGEGGMAMAQSPDTTEFDGMPRSAIATGLVDYILPPAAMPAQLIAYATHALGTALQPVTSAAPQAESALKKIHILLRAQTGHEFSQYKPSTIARRIERRMAVNQIAALDSYVKYMQQNPAEVEALFRDLLIGVTNFFRDPEAFRVLEQQAIPKLFANKPANAPLRVWVAGCSTGEEAYSLAILLVEHMEALKQSHTIQIFASDIDSQALATARAGHYPASIAADVTPERLARFFTAEPESGAYRIHKGLRDLLVFSEQDVIKDPPFSKLALVSCRNLLIYLGAELQKKLMPLFHYALNPGGMLFLGTSESVGEFGELFAAVDRSAKVYQRKGGTPGLLRAGLSGFQPALEAACPRSAPKTAFPVKLPLRELTEQALLQQVVPVGALVNSRGDILYLHGRTGLYLELPPGQTGVHNILKMAREGLLPELTTTLRKAAGLKAVVRCPGVRVKTNSHFTSVDLTVHPVPVGLTGAEPGPEAALQEETLYLVLFEEAPAAPAQVPPAAAPADGTGPRIAELERELRAKAEYIQSTHEELQSSTEELKSANEEMQSVNEELQSTNEELETTKEEMQSVNEELATVNAELQTKVADLSRTNADMNNLLAGTGIGTVFVDHQLRILRFSPTVSALINLIPTDVGRPVGHLVSNLVGYDRLVADAQAVLDSLIPRELEVQTRLGAWFLLRIRPYRTQDNVIEGVVLTFTEITELKKTQAALRETEGLRRLAVVLRDAHDAITVQDLEGRILAWNPGAERLYGWSEAEALTMNIRDRIPQALRGQTLARLARLSRAETLEPYRTQRLAKDGRTVDVWLTATALLKTDGAIYAVATTERGVGLDNQAAVAPEHA
jgi:two-component system CheB/CheR fusion protein